LNDALRAAGLSALQEEMEDGKLTLDSEISAGGNNLSVGQRQIIALGEYNVQDYLTWHNNSLQLGRLFGEANS
jgi:ABC-type bacteriocin/lantibiotic exporter with double-glycine peptidase domain